MANYVDQALQTAQTAFSAPVSMLLPAYYDMFNAVLSGFLRKEAVHSGVCICTLCSTCPHFHLGTIVLQALEICLG